MFDANAKKPKSNKQTAEEPNVESPTKKKVKFDDLNSPGAHNDGDEVYQEQVQKLRDRKANRKAVDKMLKGQAAEETEQMDQQIQRNVQKNILANRGLTRKRKKVDRNPRVKRRMKYE